MFDGSDDLIDRERWEAWGKIETLMNENPTDEYMLVVGVDHYNPHLLGYRTDLLVIQRLSQQTIERFLDNPRNAPFGSPLFDALNRHRLFDLASIPLDAAAFAPSGKKRDLSLIEDNGIGKPGRGRHSQDSIKPWHAGPGQRNSL